MPFAGKGQPFNNSSSAAYDRKYLLRGNVITRDTGFFDPLKSLKYTAFPLSSTRSGIIGRDVFRSMPELPEIAPSCGEILASFLAEGREGYLIEPPLFRHRP